MNGIRDRIGYPDSVPPEQRGKSALRIRGRRSHPFKWKGKTEVKKLGRARRVPAAITMVAAAAVVAVPATASASVRHHLPLRDHPGR